MIEIRSYANRAPILRRSLPDHEDCLSPAAAGGLQNQTVGNRSSGGLADGWFQLKWYCSTGDVSLERQ